MVNNEEGFGLESFVIAALVLGRPQYLGREVSGACRKRKEGAMMVNSKVGICFTTTQLVVDQFLELLGLGPSMVPRRVKPGWLIAIGSCVDSGDCARQIG